MKKFKSIAVALGIVCFIACTNGQSFRTVHGNGNVVTRERQTGPFTGIRVSSGIDVIVKQGDKESVSVEADENLHEYIKTEVSGDVLRVYSDANIREAERMRAYVTIRELKTASTSSAGDLVGETPFKTDVMELSASSAGDIKLEVHAREIHLNLSSSGDMTLTGDTDILEADLSSAGDLNAFDLRSREAKISVSSAGDADINVTEKLTARASSAGDINYQGNPQYIDAHSSSAGGVHKR